MKVHYIITFFLLSIKLFSQNPREIGLRVNNNDGIDLVTLKKKSDNQYNRFRLDHVNLSLVVNEGSLLSANTSISLGWANLKEKPITKQLNFIHGLEWGLGTSLLFQKNSISKYVGSVSTYAGYVLGVGCRPIPQIHLMIEMMPQVQLAYYHNGKQPSQLVLNSSFFSGNNLALSTYYTFAND